MIGALFGRVTAAVLLVALAVVGCGDAEPGGAGTVGPRSPGEATGDPNPGDPNPGDLNPGNPNPRDPNPGNPNSGNPNPGNPNPGNPNPRDPNPRHPNPGNPNPRDPNPGNPNPRDPNPGNPNPGEEEVAWVPPGPGSSAPELPPDDGDQPRPWDRWFWAFDHRDCDAIAALGQERHQRPLYEGLGDACRAVLRDEDQFWPAVEAALQNVGNPTNCLDQSALRLLRDLVTAHQRAPNAKIRIVDHPPGRECD